MTSVGHDAYPGVVHGSPEIGKFLDRHIAAGDFPGAVFLIAEGDRIVAEGWRGFAVREPESIPVRRDTIFDLSSLTKPLATTLLIALLEQEGRVRLTDRVSDHLAGFSGEDRERVLLEDLLLHRAGLPSWVPLYVGDGGAKEVIGRLLRLPLSSPPRSRVEYCCPGFILLGEVAERAAGRDLRDLFEQKVAIPLGLKDTGFLPASDRRRRIAATEVGNLWERKLAGDSAAGYSGWRQDLIWGEVHDGNAHSLGGISGNAGLFSTAADIARLAGEFMGSGAGLLSTEWRERFSRNWTGGLGEDRSPGWQLASTPDCAAHRSLPDDSFGHTGFTGVSLWIEPARKRQYILLTNRVHPEVRPISMNAIRREFHRLAREVLE